MMVDKVEDKKHKGSKPDAKTHQSKLKSVTYSTGGNVVGGSLDLRV